jgi:processive 1,2-diacylglycerol beta-glucosyltransferase
MERKKILITMIEVGFGHKSPAIAVKESIETLVGEKVQADVVDFAKVSGAIRDDLMIKGSWDLALAFPLSARIGYLLMELSGKNKQYLDVLWKEFVFKGIDYIQKYQPDLVFATHALALYVAVKARETLGLNFKVIAYVVDPFDGYAWWANEGADALLVASNESRERLLHHGIKPEIIHTIGFPIKKSFFSIQQPCKSTLEALDLDPDRITILISAGSQGIGKVYFFAEILYLLNLNINLIVVSGKNKTTKAHFDFIKKNIKSETKLASLGFATNMNELMCSSDIIAGKAGASTAMEAFFMDKPMIFTEWATYNDRYIIQFARKYKIGWYCPTISAFVNTVKRALEPGGLDAYRKNLESLMFAPGTDDVAKFLLNSIGVETPVNTPDQSAITSQ